MLHSNRTIIPGPPGTGKTYRLINHHLANELKTVAPDKILYVSFSNAASNEARKRINNLYPNKEIIISTLHSLGTRELGINTTTQLLQGSNWKAFKNYSQICQIFYLYRPLETSTPAMMKKVLVLTSSVLCNGLTMEKRLS